MKKIMIVLAAGLLALTFAGCGNGQATSQENVDTLADPWVEVTSLAEAEELAGFTVEIPSMISPDLDTVYRYCEALKEIEVQFSDPYGYLRKAKDDGDISGDYEDYAEVKEVENNGIVYVLKGPAKGMYNLAIWKVGDYSYCIGFDAPADEMTMLGYCEELI